MGEVPPIGGMRLASFFRNLPHFFEIFEFSKNVRGFENFFYVVFFAHFLSHFFIFGAIFLRFFHFFRIFDRFCIFFCTYFKIFENDTFNIIPHNYVEILVHFLRVFAQIFFLFFVGFALLL